MDSRLRGNDRLFTRPLTLLININARSDPLLPHVEQLNINNLSYTTITQNSCCQDWMFSKENAETGFFKTGSMIIDYGKHVAGEISPSGVSLPFTVICSLQF